MEEIDEVLADERPILTMTQRESLIAERKQMEA